MNKMNILEKKEFYIILFDFYETLFTEKQKQYFKDYYFDDLSLAEIASLYNVSRNAVFDQVNKVVDALDEYENKLHLYEKYEKRESLYKEYENSSNIELINKLKEIE